MVKILIIVEKTPSNPSNKKGDIYCLSINHLSTTCLLEKAKSQQSKMKNFAKREPI